MTEEGIVKAIGRKCRTHVARRSPNMRGPASGMGNVFRRSVTQEDLDDKARWLDGQVRGWAAARTL